MKKILICFAIMMASLFGFTSATSASVYAVNGEGGAADGEGGACEPGSSVFFALKPWYHNLTNSDCSIKNPADLTKGSGDSSGIATFVWTIVLNILYDISVLVGYFTIIMIAWGGYLYMFSRGDVGRAEKGKKTLISAVVGLAIAMLASVIMNTISAILIQ
ncbi:hypothetical protein IJG79_02790 [Candidatus Saccharibacteria bacterium]|nr:hypothetical protein [Candidatus Saccharibacteria bacterium]